jgi:hypothetical protein
VLFRSWKINQINQTNETQRQNEISRQKDYEFQLEFKLRVEYQNKLDFAISNLETKFKFEHDEKFKNLQEMYEIKMYELNQQVIKLQTDLKNLITNEIQHQIMYQLYSNEYKGIDTINTAHSENNSQNNYENNYGFPTYSKPLNNNFYGQPGRQYNRSYFKKQNSASTHWKSNKNLKESSAYLEKKNEFTTTNNSLQSKINSETFIEKTLQSSINLENQFDLEKSIMALVE